MWSTLIGLIERWWREKPRLDVVRAVVNLRDAMIDCQRWYLQYLDARSAGDLETLYPNPREEWLFALATLDRRVLELDTVLSIFSPEAHLAMARYLSMEDGKARGLKVAAEELREPLDLDIQNVEMKATFSEALNRLREFIAQNFKVEEIFAARRSKEMDRLGWRELPPPPYRFER